MDPRPATAGDDVRGGLDPKIQKHLTIIETEIMKSNNIIRDVLDFSRNRALNLSSQKVDELVEKAIERIQFPANVGLKKELQLGDFQVPLDEDEIRQVLVNLMENACQAMTSGGTLIVGTKSHIDQVEIIIADTGCGISPELKERIFDPFFTTKPVGKGTGLGLSISLGIVEDHAGTIELVTGQEKGAIFRMTFQASGTERAKLVGKNRTDPK